MDEKKEPMPDVNRSPIGQREWLEEGKRLFGMPATKWKFMCPVCKGIQTMDDFIVRNLDHDLVYQECIGRHIPGAQDRFLKSKRQVGPCDYAAYGLIHLGRTVKYEDRKGIKMPSIQAFPFALDLKEGLL
jgi:hypothetical protein